MHKNNICVEKHGMMTYGICIDNGWAWHLDIYDE